MTIYLRHPVHGTKVAVMAMEAEYDEQNGWERYDPNAVEEVEVEEAVSQETAVEAAPSNELEVKRRRGRSSAAAAA